MLPAVHERLPNAIPAGESGIDRCGLHEIRACSNYV